MLVLGSTRSGKTSLVHSLVDQQARLSDDMSDGTAGVDAYETSFDYDVDNGKPGEWSRVTSVFNFPLLFLFK